MVAATENGEPWWFNLVLASINSFFFFLADGVGQVGLISRAKALKVSYIDLFI